MKSNYARPLGDNNLSTQFLTNVLGYKPSMDTGDLAVKITKAEVLLSRMAAEDTLHRSSYRHPSYSSDSERVILREKIFKELISLSRLKNDDEVTLGAGGVVPITGNVKKERKAFILIGLPASGKSSISNRISDEYGAYIIDSDYAKKKFPEYKEEYGAAIVHEESTLVTFGLEDETYADEPNVLEFCIANDANLVIPKVGSKVDSIRNLRNLLLRYNYEVHLTLVKADRLCATKRALTRFCSTNRYVPISLVFDGYSNDPILSYYYMTDDAEWASIGIVSTEGNYPVHVCSTNSNPAVIYK